MNTLSYSRTVAPNRIQTMAQSSSSKSQAILWFELKNNQLAGFRFREQVPFYNHKLDFYCPQIKLAIEVQQPKNDQKEQHLAALGITLLRFSNQEIFYSLENVLMKIERKIVQLQLSNS